MSAVAVIQIIIVGIVVAAAVTAVDHVPARVGSPVVVMGVRTVVPSVIVGVRIVPAAAVVKIRVVWLRRRAGTGAAAPGTAGAAAARPAAAVVIVRRGVCSQLRGIVIPV